MPSEAAEIFWTRWEDRPQGGFSHRSRRVPRAMGVDPDDWARALRHAYVIAGQVAGQTDSAESTVFASAPVHPNSFHVRHGLYQVCMLDEDRTLAYLAHAVQSSLEAFESSFVRLQLARARSWTRRAQ
jgi:hypothetical protein